MQSLKIIISDRQLFPKVQNLFLYSLCVIEKEKLENHIWEVTVFEEEENMKLLCQQLRKLGGEEKITFTYLPVWRLSLATYIHNESSIQQILTLAIPLDNVQIIQKGDSQNGWEFYFRGPKEVLKQLQQKLKIAKLPLSTLL